MAQLNKQILGKLRGSVADIVFRQRNGKNYIASKPGSYNPSDDPASIDRRNKFALTCKFASHVNAVSYLNAVWKKKIVGGMSAFNVIAKTNYKFVDPDELTNLAMLVPELGFSVAANSSAINPPQHQVVLDPIGNIAGIDTSLEENICLCTIIALSNPDNEDLDQNAFITLASAPQQTLLDAELTFQVPYSDQEIQIFNSYQDKKAFSVLVTLDETENPVHYSNTILL
jgi:hypothetical protein